MYKKAIEVLNIFFNNGFEAYIVGGYVRDKLLDIKTNDIDICTNAKPMDIVKLFDIQSSDETQYGAVKIIYKNCKEFQSFYVPFTQVHPFFLFFFGHTTWQVKL